MLRHLLFVVSLLALQPGAAGAQPTESAPAQPGETDVTAPEEAPVIEQTPRAFEEYEASEQISEDLPVAFPVDI